MMKNRKSEKLKEELRRLAVLPGNKVCMNCPVRGPLYAVIDFNIFVCTTCSAIHRSLQHKVKGISMSEFTDEELAGLRVGGNERANLIWRVGYPYGVPHEGDERAIRSNITMCFVERRYFNANEHEKMQMDQLNASLPPVTNLPAGVSLTSNPPAATGAQSGVGTLGSSVSSSSTLPNAANAHTSALSSQSMAPRGVNANITIGGSGSHTQQIAMHGTSSHNNSNTAFPNSAVAAKAVLPPRGVQISAGAAGTILSKPVAGGDKGGNLVGGGFDDFFGGSSSSHPANGVVKAPAQQISHTSAGMDFFSSPSSAQQQQQQQTSHTATDFFGGHSTPAQPIVQGRVAEYAGYSSQPAVISPHQPSSSDDFFGGFSAGSSSTAHTSSNVKSNAVATTDFFGNSNGTGAATTGGGPYTFSQNGNNSVHSNSTDFFGAPATSSSSARQGGIFNSAGGGGAGGTTTKSKDASDAFASLYSFK